MMYLLILLLVGILAIFALIVFVTKSTNKLDVAFFKDKWQNINNLASDKNTWVQAIVESDKLLDEALKRSGYHGKSTADRMVSANRAFSNADSVWRAHKLRNKVVHELNFKLNKSMMADALKGFRQALKDLGAL